jgi:hypothetical protein
LPALRSRCRALYVPGAPPPPPEADIDAAIAFMRSAPAARKALIKDVCDAENDACDRFIRALLAVLARDPVRNHRALSELSLRSAALRQSPLNRRLQLEVVAACLP